MLVLKFTVLYALGMIGKGNPTHVRVPLPEPFKDERGEIIKLLEGVSIDSVLLIDSKAGTVRGNHYHRRDSHYCYVVRGKLEYYWRPAGSTTPPERMIISAGQMFYTPPMVEHAMRFVKDTIFLAFTSCPRDQQSYEEDTVRVKLVEASTEPAPLS
jgi:dTDP-4-dehydrorhamnose 3,5-epimerase-like enzyme